MASISPDHSGPASRLPRLRLLVFNRSYYPDVEATGQLLTELCTDLTTRHDVHVVAGQPNFVSSPMRGLVRQECHQGVSISRVRNARFSKKSMFGRAIRLFTYM